MPSVDIKHTNNTVIAQVNVHQLSTFSAMEIQQRLLRETEKPCREFVLSLKGVDDIDSSGMGMIILLHHGLSKTGSMFYLTDLSERVLGQMRAAEIDKLVRIHDSIEDVLSIVAPDQAAVV